MIKEESVTINITLTLKNHKSVQALANYLQKHHIKQYKPTTPKIGQIYLKSRIPREHNILNTLTKHGPLTTQKLYTLAHYRSKHLVAYKTFYRDITRLTLIGKTTMTPQRKGRIGSTTLISLTKDQSTRCTP